MNLTSWLEAIEVRTGLDEAEAATVLETTLECLGDGLRLSERASLAEALPAALRDAWMAGPDEGEPVDRARIVSRLATVEAVSAGLALELAAVVCSVMTEHLPASQVVFLRSRVADDLAALFVRRHEDLTELTPPPASHAFEPEAARHTLAEGRPGSDHPLSEARPTRVQPGSVAATGPDMHGGRRLSTARGTEQEQLHQTLAEGKPGSRRPLTEGH